jgi:hypothetical protein
MEVLKRTRAVQGGSLKPYQLLTVRSAAIMAALLALALSSQLGCGLTVTNEVPTYEELPPDSPERKAIDIIYSECRGFHDRVRKLRPKKAWPIDPIINKAGDRDHINTSFSGLIFVANYGDGKVHISAWENLSDAQRQIVHGWFQRPTLKESETWYKWFFYRFMAVAQCVKQYMYNEHGARWVFENRSVYVMERDAMRTALVYFKEVGRKSEIWDRTASHCAPVLKQYDARWGYLFLPKYRVNHYKLAKTYLKDNFYSLANPKDPTGYMYWICQGVAYEKTRFDPLTIELDWLETLGVDND